MRITLVLNRNAGTLRGLDPTRTAEELAEIFRAEGHSVRWEIHKGRHAIAAIARICRERSCEALVVGGGDGTVSAAAAAAAESDLALGVLPLGTMNLFARSLGIPLDLWDAARALARGRPTAVDISEVNGRYFIHHLTLGLHPQMIRIRERMQYGSRWGKIWANIQAFFIAVRQVPRLDVEIAVQGQAVRRRATIITVSNDPLGEGHFPYPDDLRQGKLGVYVSTSRSWTELLQLAARLALGEVYQNPQIESWIAEEVEIRLRRPVVRASLDGELHRLESPLRARVRRRGLLVIQPTGAEPAPARHVETANEGYKMTENLNKTEARQGDRRRMNKTVLLIGTPLAFVLLGIVYYMWA